MIATTFEAAVHAGDLPTVTQCLRQGANVNETMSSGLSPLMIASGLGEASMVSLLLTAGADVRAVEPSMGNTALHKAALSGNRQVAELLLDHGAFIDQQTPRLGHTALMDAVIYKHGDIVRLLLDRGAKTSLRNHWGETAAAIAKRDSLDDIVALLEANERGKAEHVKALRLHLAVSEGDVAETRRLIDAGEDVNARVPMVGSFDDNYTPLAVAARDGHVEIIRLLLEAGANPRGSVGLYSGTALHEACYFGHSAAIEVMCQGHEQADKRSDELDVQGALNGFTPLHDAVWHGHIDAVAALVDAGARLDIRNHAGLTPREMAVHYGYDALARLLADAEAR
ncbi:ankyrin repeat domain-containing protein [Azospirillum sp. SYSU D00513]|uniref:ankyrin repeat domain-containing protein n=1 Tax=Azospirillum sp. SYSU D00513 TaxID=2812561 RepID=UPI001A95A9AA|nr:ankyrin repeat domain-containing protein [Azospirillum sp. SYSU D00513]